jgi:hypothetical protein
MRLRGPSRETQSLVPILVAEMKHLLCHIWPRKDGLWRRTADNLRLRWSRFSGRKVVALALDGNTSSPEEVRAELPEDVEVFQFGNKPNLREVRTFVQLLEHVRGAEGETFYCHGKGSSPSHNNDGDPCHNWADAMFHVLLDWPGLVDCVLSRYPLAGCFRSFHGFGIPNNGWHYSGTFFWFRNRDVFSRNWRDIDRIWFGTETWPPKHFTREEAPCLFYDNIAATPQAPLLYQADHWNSFVWPALHRWRERCLSCGLSTTLHSRPNWSRLPETLFRSPNGKGGSGTILQAKRSWLRRMASRLRVST